MSNIVFENVSYTYNSQPVIDKTHYAVKNVSLKIEDGTFVAILGHNGSGKSTLAKLMNGVLLPTEGKVTVNGIETSDESRILEIRQSVGMVFQNPDNQIVATVVEEDVAFGPENMGVDPQTIRERVDYALDAVGMTDFRLHSPHQLSGGQKQRVAIAGVIAMLPECIIYDESTAMLDPYGRRDIINTANKLNRDKNITTVLITHYMEEAVYADRVIVMNDGEIFMDGLPRDVFSDVEKLKAIGLDVPQPTELMYMLARDGFNVPKGVMTVAEAADAIEKLIIERRK
ncbi:MAG: energy-coupling factor transporter ATPase [Ruminococcaceae bacterium]|nr:energy-coupling factor transporter ATPase [Oscillospiraceae bacterium]